MIVAGCSDSPSAPTAGESGSLSFAFTGARGAGTYTASGAIPRSQRTTLGTTSWAASVKDDSTSSLVVIASVPHTSATWDLITLLIPRITAGTDSIDVATCTGLCPFVFVDFGTQLTGDANDEYACVVDAGHLTLTAISPTRASGSFSGTGSCTSAAGTDTPFALTSGVFDVGILSSGLTLSARLADKP